MCVCVTLCEYVYIFVSVMNVCEFVCACRGGGVLTVLIVLTVLKGDILVEINDILENIGQNGQ